MIRLASILYSIVATTLAGIGIIIVLVMGYVSFPAILISAAIGAAIAVPVSYVVARKITHLTAG
jgi:putative flippase GtrA